MILDLDENDGFLLKNQLTDIADPQGYKSSGEAKGLHLFGNFDGATLQLQGTTQGLSQSGTDWVDIKDNAGTSITFSAPGFYAIELFRPKMAYRMTVSGAGGSTDVSAVMV